MANTARKVNDAMASALTRFYAQFPHIDGIALDTIREFAREKFVASCTDDRVNDSRFEAQAPEYAYLLLCRESLALAKSLAN